MVVSDTIPDPVPSQEAWSPEASILDRARLHTQLAYRLINAPNGPPFDMATFLTDVADGYLAIRDELIRSEIALRSDQH